MIALVIHCLLHEFGECNMHLNLCDKCESIFKVFEIIQQNVQSILEEYHLFHGPSCKKNISERTIKC